MENFDGLTLKTLLEKANIGVVIHKWDTSIVYANPTALELLRLTYDQIIGKDAYDPQWRFIDEGNRPLLNEQFPVSQVKRFKNPLSNEVLGVIDGNNAKPTWFTVNAYPELADNEKESFIVVTFNDISANKNLFSFKNIVDNALDVIIVTEAEDISRPLGPRIIYVNKAFEKLTGYSRKEAIGETPRILQGKHTDRNELARVRQALQQQEPVSTTIQNYSKTGHPYWLNMNIFPLRNKYDEVTHFAAIERDVTEQIYNSEQLKNRNKSLKELKNNLQEMIQLKTQELHDTNKLLQKYAYYDSVTNIPNRRSFLEQARQQISRARRGDYVILTGMLDIDCFKQVNDSYGHDIGDKVLIEVARMLSLIFRQEDIYGRFGGEEFAFCMLINDQKQAFDICERLRIKIEHARVIIEGDEELGVTVSIGASVTSVSESISLQAELKNADTALYEAKVAGRNCAKIEYKE
jgi:diguanylate cyclase (GGDEF)-like protein/PAS domain S-box-containing protein